MKLEASRIAVLDVNHGGLVLAGELKALGYDAFAVDVYGTSRRKDDAGIHVVKPSEAGEYDLLVTPVHLNYAPIMKDAGKLGARIITHHRMTGMLIEATGRLKGVRSIEVTGTYGKTTTCTILAGMLRSAGEKILLHASTGLTYDGEPLGDRLSITPANIIKALDRARDAGIHPTTCIFEVSLGGCGTADVGVITALDRGYPIAGGTKMSYTAKMQMIENARPDCTIIHDSSYRVGLGLSEITFGEGGDLCFGRDGAMEGWMLNNPIKPSFSPGLDIDTYAVPILCATTAALRLGVPESAIGKSLSGFSGIPGRMKLDTIEGRTLLDNSCSGLTIDGVMHALGRCHAYSRRKVLVLGEERYNVCEGLNPEQASRIAAEWIDDVVLVGDRLRSAGKLNAASLEEGIRTAIRMTSPGDMIISCVKTWR